jgi:uncharacterized protein
MIAPTIQAKLALAMKARDDVRLSTLRMLSSAINYEKIAKQHELTEDEEIAVVRREVKKRTDAIAAYTSAKAETKAQMEAQERDILKEFLPPEMEEGQLAQIIKDVITETSASGMKDMGKVIAEVKNKVGSAADGSTIAAKVKELLSI